ncbi:hypothetical protein QLX08_001034 [Tetragonisca angustula]|uniref:Uncharacterized protein n=1 Tax=Tetragonisca angustula TaxID=166442 RepID=A0AAW1AGJ6_9HYME
MWRTKVKRRRGLLSLDDAIRGEVRGADIAGGKQYHEVGTRVSLEVRIRKCLRPGHQQRTTLNLLRKSRTGLRRWQHREEDSLGASPYPLARNQDRE